MRLTWTHKRALRRGSVGQWLGTREVGVQGNTMQALADRGLAEVRATRWPYRRMVYRLTDAGEAERRRWFGERDPREFAAPAPALTRRDLLAELIKEYPSVASEGVRCRCTHCGAEFEDATPGGSCGRCGLAVAAI